MLKKLAFKYFPDELAKSSTNQQNEGGSLVGKVYIEKAMENIEYSTVVQISKLLKINTVIVESIDPSIETRRKILIELISSKISTKNTIFSCSSILSSPSLPITPCLAYPSAHSNPLNLPTYTSYLFFQASQTLSTSILSQVSSLSTHISPTFSLDKRFTNFESWHKQACPLYYSRILSISPPLVGQEHPAEVLLEVEFNLSLFPSSVVEAWVGIRPGEILGFVTYKWAGADWEVERIRCAEVKGVVYSSQSADKRREERQKFVLEQRMRVYLVFDPIQFKKDQQESVIEGFNIDDVYQGFHVGMRFERSDSAIKYALDKIKKI